MERTLHIIAYDVSEPGRLAKVHNLLKGYSTGGQKSAYECFLTDGDLNTVKASLEGLIDEQADRIHIFQLDGRSRTHTLGIAVQPKDPAYFYIG